MKCIHYLRDNPDAIKVTVVLYDIEGQNEQAEWLLKHKSRGHYWYELNHKLEYNGHNHFTVIDSVKYLFSVERDAVLFSLRFS